MSTTMTFLGQFSLDDPIFTPMTFDPDLDANFIQAKFFLKLALSILHNSRKKKNGISMCLESMGILVPTGSCGIFNDIALDKYWGCLLKQTMFLTVIDFQYVLFILSCSHSFSLFPNNNQLHLPRLPALLKSYTYLRNFRKKSLTKIFKTLLD